MLILSKHEDDSFVHYENGKKSNGYNASQQMLSLDEVSIPTSIEQTRVQSKNDNYGYKDATNVSFISKSKNSSKTPTNRIQDVRSIQQKLSANYDTLLK